MPPARLDGAHPFNEGSYLGVQQFGLTRQVAGRIQQMTRRLRKSSPSGHSRSPQHVLTASQLPHLAAYPANLCRHLYGPVSARPTPRSRRASKACQISSTGTPTAMSRARRTSETPSESSGGTPKIAPSPA